jgi:hypothetical protein
MPDLIVPPWPLPERIPLQGRSVRLEPLGREHAGEFWRSAEGGRADMGLSALRTFRVGRRTAPAGGGTGGADRSAVLGGTAANQRRRRGVAVAMRHLSSRWRDRDRQHLVFPGAATDPGRDRGNLPVDAIRDGRVAIPAIGLAMHGCQPGFDERRRRYGFKPEGIWRGSAFAKGRRWDQAWFSILADEWPARSAAIRTWLADENFDAQGRARSRIV